MRKNTLSRIAVVAFVAVALAFLWGSGLGWFISTVLQPNYVALYEEIVVAPDGTPLVETTSQSDWRTTELRTIEGTLLPGRLVNRLEPARFSSLAKPPGLWDVSLPWNQRIHSFYNSGSPSSRWYFIVDEQAPGTGYFAVFDATTKLPIGYFGRSGFRANVPTADECFQLGNAYGSYRHLAPVVSTAPNGLGIYPMGYGNAVIWGSEIPSWLLFVRDGNAVRQIDMRTREIRTLFELPELMALSTITEVRVEDQAASTDNTAEETGAAADAWAAKLRSFADSEQKMKLALRSPNQFAIVDPKSATGEIFELPESIRDREFWAYSIGNGQLLLHVDGGWVRAERKSELIWIDETGKELRREAMQLAGYVPTGPRQRAWGGSAMAPIPLGWIIAGGGLAAAERLQNNQAITYVASVRQVLNDIWPPLIVVLLAGAICTVIALRWHRQYRRPDAWVWAATVFLFGPAGLLAYWIHWNRPPRERCASCGALAPRDCEACAACQTEFAPLPLLGTEVFA